MLFKKIGREKNASHFDQKILGGSREPTRSLCTQATSPPLVFLLLPPPPASTTIFPLELLAQCLEAFARALFALLLFWTGIRHAESLRVSN